MISLHDIYCSNSIPHIIGDHSLAYAVCDPEIRLKKPYSYNFNYSTNFLAGYSLQFLSSSATNRMLMTSSYLGRYNTDILPVRASNRACLTYDFLHPRVLTMVLYQQIEGQQSVSSIVYSYTYNDSDTTPRPFKGQFELSLIGDNVLIQTVVIMSEYGILNRLSLEPTTCSKSGELTRLHTKCICSHLIIRLNFFADKCTIY